MKKFYIKRVYFAKFSLISRCLRKIAEKDEPPIIPNSNGKTCQQKFVKTLAYFKSHFVQKYALVYLPFAQIFSVLRIQVS